MTYVMSDLHGCQRMYRAMLQQISFSPEDTLYIIGDVIDRGAQGIPILLHMMAHPNIRFLMGNHERMMLDVIEGQNEPAEMLALHLARWRHNGGEVTRQAFLAQDPATQRAILAYLHAAPYEVLLTAGGREYHLVHAAPSPLGNTYDMVWARFDKEEAFYSRQPIPPGRTVLFGHTATNRYQPCQPLAIWRGKQVIGLDCGCAMQAPASRLACLRLEDQAEFYVAYRPG